MKIHKGEAGYLRAQKKKVTLLTILYFAVIAAILAVGYHLYHTRLNLLTVLAVLLCLPACRTLVRLIMLIPHHSVDEATELEISGCTDHLCMIYDLVITSERKAMPIDAVAISGNTVCGYSRSRSVDTDYASRHIKAILKQNKLDKITVKIFHDYVAFLSRAEGMNNIASVEKKMPGKREAEISQIILNISL